jgi:hypothetical protein
LLRDSSTRVLNFGNDQLLFAEALYPYPNDLVICAKVGGTRKSDKSRLTYKKLKILVAGISNNRTDSAGSTADVTGYLNDVAKAGNKCYNTDILGRQYQIERGISKEFVGN